MALGQQLVQRFAGGWSQGRRRVYPLPTSHVQFMPHTKSRLNAPCIFWGHVYVGWTSTLATAAGSRAASTPSAATQQQPGHGLVGTLPFNEDEYVEVGQVVGAHGVKGGLRLELSTDQPAERFRAGRRLYLLPPSGGGRASRTEPQEPVLIAVTAQGAKMRPLGKGEEAWMVDLEEVTTRTQAEQLRGCVVYCAAADRGALRDPDEFYVTDIIGCTVIDQATRCMVGLVVDVYGGTGTHDTLRIKLRANEEDILNSRIRYCMIPFAKAICPVLDLSKRTLEVAPPEGLLELVTEEKLRKPLSDAVKAQKLAQLRELQAQEAHLQLPSSPSQPQKTDGDEGEDEEDDERTAAAGAPSVKASRAVGTARSQPQSMGSWQARGSRAGGDSSRGEDDGLGGQDQEDGTQQGGEAGAGAGRWRRPALRRRPGSLRLGRRRE
ncbi:hypothetical protein Vretimale_4909 [Volvox reticuliferus]|uniref:RimM N-terminal domain-containing protein n=1 Tax=Volvox reticuliferus TaxID=1737510 RepID=A0A8J4G2V4_9CHLO|nr:hypothetical protein Vretifemale_3535 [Volvox reticuliferus]GIL99792.1 hypothetical protein Vretimale_4909 [Volvox reticuliferus]